MHTEVNRDKKLTKDVSPSHESYRVIIAGGGTGGHIFPAIAIANALKRLQPGVEILFVGAKGKMEMDKVPEAGYRITGLTIAGYDRGSLVKNFSLPVKLIKSFLEVNTVLKNFKPDAVVGVGGYSSFPVLRLAQIRKIPTFIHESNSLPGKSNMILGKRATGIFVATDNMEKYFPGKKIIITGNPVREELSVRIPKSESLRFFGLKENMQTVFVMGGSLGAKSINETIEENIDLFKKNGLQLIWQTGKLFSERAAKIEEDRSNIWTNAFINRMDHAYNAADIVVARSGAMTIAELCTVGKPSILVPYPLAAEDHQLVNAMALVGKNAARLVRDEEVKTSLMKQLLALAGDEIMMEDLRKNIAALGNPKADEMIVREILKNNKQ
ncbi:MAG: undecaprenyldiphospho-muramoylpentapeptide beta-N-acetylglucosaminyltransferase [Ginsengibacter sp.]